MKYSHQHVQKFIKDGHTCVVLEDYVLLEEDQPKFGQKFSLLLIMCSH